MAQVYKLGTALCYREAAAVHNLQFKIVLGLFGAACYTVSIYIAALNIRPYP